MSHCSSQPFFVHTQLQQQWNTPHFYQPYPTTTTPQLYYTQQPQLPHLQKRPLQTDEDDLNDFNVETTTFQDDRKTLPNDRTQYIPKKKRRKTLSQRQLTPDHANISSKTKEKLQPYDDPSAPVVESGFEGEDSEFDGYLDIRGTSQIEENKVDDNPTSFHSLPLIHLPRLPTIKISPSLGPASLPKNVTSSGRRNRTWGNEEPNGMEIFDDSGREETQKEGTMVIYRPPLSFEPLNIDDVAEGMREMDLD